MIIDAFMFHNELDLLEIRLAELQDVVDEFLIVECTWTHQGRAKPLHFWNARERFTPLLTKIRHVAVEDMPPDRRPEILEPFHRNCILRGIADRRDTDLVMVSDLDEIPSARAVREYVAGRSRGIAAFEQSLYYYWMDCRMCQCTGTRIATVADARKWTPQRLRHHPEAMQTLRKDNEPNWAGWHFSYLGGPQAIRAKTQAFCHPGCAAPNYMNEENLQKCLATGADLYGRGGGHFVELDCSWPEYLLANRERFAHFLSERSRLVSQP